MKKLIAMLLCLSMVFALCLPTYAIGGGPNTELPLDPIDQGYPKDENLKFAAASFSLDSKIIFSCFVSKAALEGYDNWYVDFYNMDSVDYDVTVFGMDYGTPYGNMILFQLPVYVCQMSDRIHATIYAEKDNEIYEGQSISSSVEQFVLQMMPAVNAKQQKLMANMLEYGAKLQTYFNYRFIHLANDELGTYASLVDHDPPAVTNIYASTNTGLSKARISVRAMAMSTIMEMQYVIRYASGVDPLATYVEFEIDGNIIRIEGKDLVASGKNYVAIMSDIMPNQGDSEIHITIRDAATDEALSETYTDSVASGVSGWQNASGANEKLVDAINAMMNYYRAVAAVFNK